MIRDDIAVTNNEAERRYETLVDGHLAILQYEQRGGRIVYLHTAVPEALAGRGIGSALARTALEDARARQLKVVPSCPFVRAFIQRHSEYLPLVDPATRARLARTRAQ